MLTGATIVGKCLIGSNTIFGAHSFVKDLDVPNNSIVVGRYPNHRFLPLSKEIKAEYFDIFNRSNGNL
jgi:serine O-acetyltransferase